MLKTKYWNEGRAAHAYDVIFWSDKELQRRYSNRLGVIYLVERPNRIEISFVDQNKQRAFDFLKAYSKIYIEEQNRIKARGLEDLFLNAKSNAENLEREIMKTPISLKEDIELVSAVMEDWADLSDDLDLLLKEDQRLIQRAEILEKLKGSNPNFRDLMNKLVLLRVSENDSLVLQMLKNPDRYPSFEEEVDKIAESDNQKHLIISESLILEQKEHSRAYALRPFFLGLLNESNVKLVSQRKLLLWERYLNENQLMIEGKLEASKHRDAIVESDPTHLILGNAGLKRKQLAILWTFSGLFLAIGFCFFYYSRGRINSVDQLRSFQDFDGAHIWSSRLNDLHSREMFTRLDIELGKENKVIAIVGHGNTEELHEFMRELNASFTRFGQKCLFINAPEIQEITQRSIPDGATSGWWMSNAPQKMVETEKSGFDRVFVCLPSLSDTPEAKGFLRKSDLAFYFMHKTHSTIEEWKDWKSISSALNVKGRDFFIV